MKALLLAAGLGTRLRPYTDVLPKPLFPILGVPSIEWVLAGLRAAGIAEAVVNLHHLPEAVVKAIGDGSRSGVRVSYSFEPRILGTGGALVAARSLLGDGEAFIVHNADIFNDWDLSIIAGARVPALAVTDGPGLFESDRRVELTDNGMVAGLRGLPSVGKGRRVVYGGLAVLDSSVVDLLIAAMPGFPGTLSPACLVLDALIPMLSAGVPVGAVQYDSRWFCDTGTPESYLALNFRALSDVPGLFGRRGFSIPREIESGVFLGAGAKVGRGVRFVPPVLVGDGAEVGDNAALGPLVVVSGSVAPGASVSRAVVMAGAHAEGFVEGILTPGEAARA